MHRKDLIGKKNGYILQIEERTFVCLFIFVLILQHCEYCFFCLFHCLSLLSIASCTCSVHTYSRNTLEMEQQFESVTVRVTNDAPLHPPRASDSTHRPVCSSSLLCAECELTCRPDVSCREEWIIFPRDLRPGLDQRGDGLPDHSDRLVPNKAEPSPVMSHSSW